MNSPDHEISRFGRPVRLGIIGTGEIVRMVLPTLKECAALKITAIAGTNYPAAAKLAGRFSGAVAFSDYRELLRMDILDAVYIATPPPLHAEMIKTSLRASKHVVCEKPLVIKPGELEAIIAIHRQSPSLKVASCSSRFQICPPVRKARAMITEGLLGKILKVRLNNWIEYPAPLASLPAWKQSRATSGGGLVTDWGVYDLDWLRYLLGEVFDPVSITGTISHLGRDESDLETGYAATLQCRDGTMIAWERGPEHGPQLQRAEIRGSLAGLDLPFMPGDQPETLTSFKLTNRNSIEQKSHPERMNDWGTILAHPVIDLVEALAKNREVASPLSAQRKIYDTLAALYESALTGRSVPLAESV
jgi:predicted dehydrogenase